MIEWKNRNIFHPGNFLSSFEKEGNEASKFCIVVKFDQFWTVVLTLTASDWCSVETVTRLQQFPA